MHLEDLLGDIETNDADLHGVAPVAVETAIMSRRCRVQGAVHLINGRLLNESDLLVGAGPRGTEHLAHGLQRRTPALEARLGDARRVRSDLPRAKGPGAAHCQKLRASARRFTSHQGRANVGNNLKVNQSKGATSFRKADIVIGRRPGLPEPSALLSILQIFFLRSLDDQLRRELIKSERDRTHQNLGFGEFFIFSS